ncbi:MAG: phage antirepressor KilAC domain-containing protein [Clostridium celatum]|nr:phage antirepressor KilAC domain-containing protein [Clostridium celatum]
MINGLININTNSEEITLSGRELHEFLEIKTPYAKWFGRMIEYGFDENIDYATVGQKCPIANGGYQEVQDHEIKLDMAKEISMIQRSAKGRQARKYFIEVEKMWNSPEMIMKRALEIANKKVEHLQLVTSKQKQLIGELKPKADYTDKILKNTGLVTITQIAKDYGMSGQKMNELLHNLKVQYKQSDQWLLYSEHHGKGYTHSETVDIKRSDGREDIKMNTKWTQKGRLFIYDLLKKNYILPLIEK